MENRLGSSRNHGNQSHGLTSSIFRQLGCQFIDELIDCLQLQPLKRGDACEGLRRGKLFVEVISNGRLGKIGHEHRAAGIKESDLVQRDLVYRET